MNKTRSQQKRDDSSPTQQTEEFLAGQQLRKNFLIMLDVWLTFVRPFIGTEITRSHFRGYEKQLNIIRAFAKIRPSVVPEYNGKLATASCMLSEIQIAERAEEVREMAAHLGEWITQELSLLP